MKAHYTRIVIVVSILAMMSVPGSAVLQEITYRGTVTGLDPANGTLTLQATHTWGCTFGNTTTCGWNPVPTVNLTGTVTVPEVFAGVSPGMTVEATSIGGPGGRWIGIGTIFPTPGIENWIARDLFGDPSALPAPLEADFSLSTETIPDCTRCEVTVCTAARAMVNVSQIGGMSQETDLMPGQMFTFSERNDNSSLTVTFLRGEASSSACPGAEPLAGGVQPVSDFIVHVQQPIASVPTTEATTGTPAATSPPPSPTAGTFPFLPCIALTLLLLAMFRKNRNA